MRIALETSSEPQLSGADDLKTMALVDACYLSARERRAVSIAEVALVDPPKKKKKKKHATFDPQWAKAKKQCRLNIDDNHK